MNILYITSEDLNEDNTFASIFELAQAKALQKLKHDVTILSVGNISMYFIIKSIYYKILGKPAPHYRFLNLSILNLIFEGFKCLFYTAFCRARVRKIIIEGVSVFESVYYNFYPKHTEEQWVDTGFQGFLTFYKDSQNLNLIHAHSRFLLAGLLAKKIYSDFGIKYIVTEHSTFYKRNLVQPYQKELMQEVIKDSSLFIAVSKDLGNTINNVLNQNYKFKVVPNILDPEFENLNIGSIHSDNLFKILNVAALVKHKAHALLIESFNEFCKIVPNSILEIGGSGGELNSLKGLVKRLDLEDKVRFIGQLTKSEVRQKMVDCDLFVLPSDFETFGVVVIEALACGKPVVATECGGPEEIIDSSNGIIVPVQNPKELEKALIKIYKNRSLFDHKIIRDNCIQKYGSHSIGIKLEKLYHQVIQ